MVTIEAQLKQSKQQVTKAELERDQLNEQLSDSQAKNVSLSTELHAKNQDSEHALTRYILLTASRIQNESGGEVIAQQMVNDARISLDNPNDKALIQSLGKEVLKMVKKYA